MVPAENTEIILGHRCEYTHIKNQPGALADLQMTFAFVPCKHYLLINVEPEMVSLALRFLCYSKRVFGNIFMKLSETLCRTQSNI